MNLEITAFLHQDSQCARCWKKKKKSVKFAHQKLAKHAKMKNQTIQRARSYRTSAQKSTSIIVIFDKSIRPMCCRFAFAMSMCVFEMMFFLKRSGSIFLAQEMNDGSSVVVAFLHNIFFTSERINLSIY